MAPSGTGSGSSNSRLRLAGQAPRHMCLGRGVLLPAGRSLSQVTQAGAVDDRRQPGLIASRVQVQRLDADLGPELRRLAAAGNEMCQLACQHLERAGEADGGNRDV